MSQQPLDQPTFERPPQRKFSAARFTRLTLAGLMFGLVLSTVYYALKALPARPAAAPPDPRATLLTPPPQTPTPSTTASLEPTAAPTITSSPMPLAPTATFVATHRETVVLAIDDGLASHLYAFMPEEGRFQRLTDGAWRDIHPAVSPNGRTIAFASNRSGYWDLYLLDMTDASLLRLTETTAYDGSPTWSPDGLWLAYESYESHSEGGSLDIFIRPVDGSQKPVALADDPAADHSPTWDPQGRRIAFVSTRTGDAEIWTANLDRVEDRFKNISRSSASLESHPAWSPDGTRLAWSSLDTYGSRSLQLWDPAQPDLRPTTLNSGDWPVFTLAGNALLAELRQPNTNYITGYALDGSLTLPILTLPAGINGLTYLANGLPEQLPAELAVGAGVAPGPSEPLWTPVLSGEAGLPAGRAQVVPLSGLASGDLLLHDGVDESFNELRTTIAELTGWDFLSNLEDAFRPLTAPLGPGMIEDWLHTGRAFRFNTAAADAGWMTLVREDFGPQTYWRVYVRARFQEGLLGEPIHDQVWNLADRHTGNPVAYEQGGSRLPSPPEGYWIDLTRVAAAYGWERVPSLSAWRAAYSAVRYNELVLRDRRDWLSAMLEIYPKAALDTPTPVSSPTMTLTPSNTPLPSPTMTRPPYKSKTPTPTLTRRPTNTPTATATPRPTRTPTATATLRPTRSPTPSTSGP